MPNAFESVVARCQVALRGSWMGCSDGDDAVDPLWCQDGSAVDGLSAPVMPDQIHTLYVECLDKGHGILS